MYNINRLKTEKIAVKFDTKEQYLKVIHALYGEDKNGYYNDSSYYYRFYEIDQYDYFGYDSKNYLEKQRCTLINFNEIIFETMLTKSILKVGMTAGELSEYIKNELVVPYYNHNHKLKYNEGYNMKTAHPYKKIVEVGEDYVRFDFNTAGRFKFKDLFIYDITNENSKIIGYRCPIDMYNGDIKKETIYMPLSSKENSPMYAATINGNAIDDGRTNLPREIVTTWEPIYEEIKEETILIGDGQLKCEISKGKIWCDGSNFPIESIKNLANLKRQPDIYTSSKVYMTTIEGKVKIGCLIITFEELNSIINIYEKYNK